MVADEKTVASEIDPAENVADQSERELKLSPADPNHAKAMDIARKAFRTYAETFRELAK